jgi:acyl carrier protein
VSSPSAEEDLIENGIIDSLTFVELIAQLEQEFSIRIPLENIDLDHFRSIARMSRFIQTLPNSEGPVGYYSKV